MRAKYHRSHVGKPTNGIPGVNWVFHYTNVECLTVPNRLCKPSYFNPGTQETDENNIVIPNRYESYEHVHRHTHSYSHVESVDSIKYSSSLLCLINVTDYLLAVCKKSDLNKVILNNSLGTLDHDLNFKFNAL